MTSIYLFCAVAGFAWAGLSALFGAFGHGGEAGHGHFHVGDAHAPGGHFGVGAHHDVGTGHAHGGGTDFQHGEVHFPAFGPTAIAGYVTGFGAFGMLATGLGITSPFLSIPIALGGSATMGLGLAYATFKLIQIGEVSSTVSLQAMVGREAQISVSIPASGVGEVMFTAGGTRRTAPARTIEGGGLPTGRSVRVARIEGGIFFVEEEAPASPASGEAPAAPAALGTPAELPGKKE